MTILRRSLGAIAAVAVIALIVYAFLPAVVAVDMATVEQGRLEVTVQEEGKTRIRERYVVSSPLAGRVLRIELDPGDEIQANKTLLATIEPSAPSLLDARALAQSEANVKAAEANRKRAAAELKRAEAALEHAQSGFTRVQSLRETGAAAVDQMEDAELLLRSSTEQHEAAKFNVNIAEYEMEQSKAALLRYQPVAEKSDSEEPGAWRMEIHSPIDGQILRVFQESAAVVTPGTPLVEVGNPRDLEVEVDVLSEDAVKIKPGNSVRIKHWGGSEVLDGTVRLVEPSAFTKISALGVEEQRVNIIVDFKGPLEGRASLGDGYRVEAEILIWEGEDVVKVPVSALFRQEDQWSVFVVDNGYARARPVEVGVRNSIEARVLSGLVAGEVVVIHPGDQVQEGTQIEPRS